MPIPFIVLSSSQTGTGPTLADYRHRLADELGFYLRTTVSTVATSGEATRVVLANEIRDDEAGYDFMGRPWLYVASGNQSGTQRRILTEDGVGYQGSRSALMLSRPLAGALASGDAIEITSPLPVKRHLAIKGLNDLVNEALDRIWLEARISITGNGTYSYSKASYPWLTRYDQTRGIYDTLWLSSGEAPALSPYGYRLDVNGQSRTLVTEQSYTTADTFQLAVFVRASRLVYDGASWSYVTSPTGLLNDTYQAAAAEEWVATFGMVKALQHLTRLTLMDRRMDKDEKILMLADLVSRRQQYALAAGEIKRREFPKSLPERSRSFLYAPADPVWA